MSIQKATKIAKHAVGQGWKGKLDSEVAADGVRITTLILNRNDETLEILWNKEEFSQASYYMFGEWLATLKALEECKPVIFGWPDILQLYALFPQRNRVELTQTYKRIPFDWETATNDEIISKLVGRKVFWYDHCEAKIRVDVVVDVKVKSKVDVIAEVGHRKLFNYNGVDTFRSLLLDTLIKVA